jgi:hypothetical protein
LSVGGPRVDALVALYSRIIDLENLHHIASSFTEEGRAALVYRIGWLNGMFNPMIPDAFYFLQLSCREDR